MSFFSEKPSEEDLAKRFGYEEDYYSGEDTLILKNIRMMIMTMMMIIVVLMLIIRIVMRIIPIQDNMIMKMIAILMLLIE